ncbi:MAG: PLP-dependent cysteine synthase family protein [Alphaproteobacteria bacterium]
MTTFKSPLDAIGNTPLVKIPLACAATVYAKMEYMNPGGSIKDRSALYMVQQAEKKGLLAPGGTIVEPSSGNMGIALSMIGRIKGYRVIITASEKTAKQKIDTLKAYGAEVLLCPPASAEDPKGYREQARKIAAEMGAFMPNQFHNQDNAMAHYHGIGPEIWRETQGKVTHFVAAAGTGGTVCGVAKFLKEQNKDIKVYAVDPETSFYSTQGNPRPYAVEAFGIDAITELLDFSLLDGVIPVSDVEVFEMTRRLCHDYGHLVGFSAGAAALAIMKLAETLEPHHTVVFPLCDSGKPYLQKLFA